MTPERWQQVKQVLQSALERSPDQRAAFLTEACGGDQELRREVGLLLEHDRTRESIRPAWQWKDAAAGSDTLNPSARSVPAAVGRYRILRVVGEGGMGTVYEAEQDQPRRIVALKVIKPGLTGGEMLWRFEREAQMLARLQHSGIAQIYEAGTAEAGFGPQPYFAMEFIHGKPLQEFAESRQLSVRQRLDLMAKVCDAVEHAHQRGIIHRDLKPGNILVDESGQPKILDFGVARATDSDTQVTRQTDAGQIIGTLAYMSPEQVAADPLDLDTRSDVYALGVILYELLANRLPYQLSHQLHEAARAIREDDPTRLSSINRNYRGDIETIVAKALEKDKGRRYASAADLASDIRRCLTDQPIAARPASASYQLRKFARRHKAVVSATVLVFAVLVVGIVVTATEAVRARRAEQTAQAVNDFLQHDLLAQASASVQASPGTKPDPDLKVRTALDRAAARISGKFDWQPEVEAAIRDTIGQTYLDLGLFPQGRAQLERSLELERRTLGAKNPKTLETMSRLGDAARLQGKYPEAEALLQQALDDQRRVLGPNHPSVLTSMDYLANVYQFRGKYPQAEELLREVVELRRRVLGPENSATLVSMTNLGSVYLSEGKYPEAEAIQKQSLEIKRRVIGPEHPNTLTAMHNLAVIISAQGKFPEAEALNSETLQILRRVLGPEHPSTLASMNNLADNYAQQGKYAQAEALNKQTLEIRRRVLGPEHPQTLSSMSNLADVYFKQGKYSAAEALDTQVLEIRRRVLGAGHPKTLETMNNLAGAYLEQGNYAQAEMVLRQTVEASTKALGPEHSTTLNAMNNLAFVQGLRGKYPESEALFHEALETSRRTEGGQHPLTLSILALEATIYQREGKYASAETAAAEALAGRRHALGSDHPATVASIADVALAYISEGKFVQGETLAREVLEFYRKKAPDDAERFRAESLLGASWAGQKKYSEAEPLLLEGYNGMLGRKNRMSAPDQVEREQAKEFLVQLYRAWGKTAKAAEWRSRQ